MSKCGTADEAKGILDACSRRLRGVNSGRLLIGMVLLGLLWRTVRYLLEFPLWGDEAMLASNLMTRDFTGLLRPLDFYQIAPIAFLWAQLALVKTLGISELALRLLPYAMGVISVLVFWRFAHRLVDRRSVLLAVAIFACSHYLARYSAETKPYSSDLLIALGMTWAGWAVFQEPENAGRWLLLIAISAAALWASYPAVFVAGGTGFVLTWHVLRRPSFRLVACWLAYGVCIALSFVGLLVFFAHYHYEGTEAWLVEYWRSAFPPLGSLRRLPLWLLNVHTTGLEAHPSGRIEAVRIVAFLLVVVGAVWLGHRNRSLVILLLSPLLFNFVAAAMKRYPYGISARTSLYLAPAFCLLMGTGLNATLRALLTKRRVSVGIVLAALIMSLVAIAGVRADIVRPYKNELEFKERQVLTELAKRSQPDDEWVIFNAFGKVDYAPDTHDYARYGAIFQYYVTRTAPCSLVWSPPPGDIPLAPSGRTWLIVYHHNKIRIREGQLASYRQKLIERLGEPRRYYFPLGRTIEAIEVYEFPEKTQGQPGAIRKKP